MSRLCLMISAAAVAAACSYDPPPQPSPTPSAASSTGVASPDRPTNFIAHLTGDNEIPANASLGQGQVLFQLNPAGTELSYRLISSNIENVVASHIHLGPVDDNGPVVQFLFGSVPPGGGAQNGVLATGTIDGSALAGPLAGMGLGALIDAMVAGDTYVNVHTNDGVDPTNTGPGDIPGGEIRGQVRLVGK